MLREACASIPVFHPADWAYRAAGSTKSFGQTPGALRVRSPRIRRAGRFAFMSLRARIRGLRALAEIPPTYIKNRNSKTEVGFSLTLKGEACTAETQRSQRTAKARKADPSPTSAENAAGFPSAALRAGGMTAIRPARDPNGSGDGRLSGQMKFEVRHEIV